RQTYQRDERRQQSVMDCGEIGYGPKPRVEPLHTSWAESWGITFSPRPCWINGLLGGIRPRDETEHSWIFWRSFSLANALCSRTRKSDVTTALKAQKVAVSGGIRRALVEN